ncbi:helix-turn-helix transcriptional regulator [Sphingomonas sp. ID0503]|uniref:helix-turn-helix transcriptional regulator n=1 Tax=Sphingomonas sp. ID0503 TaxID=3399691 RepID=UPI003AFA5595
MALSQTDETELLVPLHAGVTEEPRWQTFLRRMQRRLLADHVAIIIGLDGVSIRSASMWVAGRDYRFEEEKFARLATLDPTPFHRLRPERVYTMAEFLQPGDHEHDTYRREYLEPLAVGHARLMRVKGPRRSNLWFTAVRGGSDFSATDGALISSLAPHLGVALRSLAHIEQLVLASTMQADVLRRAGLGWTVLDAHSEELATSGSGLEDPTAFASMRIEPPEWRPATMPPPAAMQLVSDPPSAGTAAATALCESYELTAQEARLALALAAGRSVVEAAEALSLSLESARTYLKRIFAKTGTHGQVDLVRLILTGPERLA